MAIIIRGNEWRLRADVTWLQSAARKWGTAATAYSASESLMGTSLGKLECTWSGSRADSYRSHAEALRGGIGQASDLAGNLRDALQTLSSALEDAQSDLDASFARARTGGAVIYQDEYEIHFQVADDNDDPMPNLDTEVATARDIVDEARAAVRTAAQTLTDLADDGSDLANAWRGTATGTPGWDVPAGGISGVVTTTYGDTTVVNSADDDEQIVVAVDPATGETVLTITNVTTGDVEEVRIPADQTVVINAGDGNDEITIEAGVPAHIRVVAGDGDDIVNTREHDGDISIFGGDGNDVIEAGTGDDYISGGAGHDYVDAGGGNDTAFGGDGNDVLYGMDGDDVLFGGLGDDYLEGARGDDVLFGGAGNDILSGGRDDDALFGGADDDVLYAGSGLDRSTGGTGDDTAHVEGFETSRTDAENVEEVTIDDELGAGAFDIQGDPEYIARVEADLDMMRSSPAGQEMLEALWGYHLDTGDQVEVVDHTNLDGGNSANTNGTVTYNDSRLLIDPDYPWFADGRPPVVGLFHELGHIHQYWSGEDDGQFGSPGSRTTDDDGQPLIERQNVGLPWDHDNDPDTPDVIDPDYNYVLTENGFREELGLPRRERY